jgi:2-polyprenyl-6-methoxyphenol hydroxylase-like FAD-dependent oxidoreductase
LAKTHGDLPGFGVTRPYLEWQIRRRLGEHGNVRILSPRTVAGLLTSPDGDLITGVRLTPAPGGEPADTLPADLVVDASGRQSRTPHWLTEIGYRPPVEQQIKIDLTYASWFMTAEPTLLGGDLGVVVGFTQAIPRAGSVIRVEGNKWLVALAGYAGSHPPTTQEDCLDFAQHLAVPDVYQALRGATTQDRPTYFRVRHAVRRHYQRLDRFPEGLVVLGDAACCFNPVYGQGMSVAAAQALILREDLRQGRRSVASLRRQMARAGEVAWAMSVNSDLRLPWISGRRTPLIRAANAYTALLFRAAHHDPKVARTFFRVAHLVERPTTLARPNITARVLLGSARRIAPLPVPCTPHTSQTNPQAASHTVGTKSTDASDE